MPQMLPSGRVRGRVRHPRTGKQIAPHTVIGGPTTYDDLAAARAAEREASDVLRAAAGAAMTVGDFFDEWTTSPLWVDRRVESTNIHNRERVSKFVALYRDRAIRSIDDAVVVEYLKGGHNNSRVMALRAFFNDAMTAEAGRLVALNPFANLRIKHGTGRRNVQPPDQVGAARLIALADEMTPPSFAAYLDLAIHEGWRPGEGDGLRVSQLNLTAGTVDINNQWNVKARKMTLPKHGVCRLIALTGPALTRLATLPLDGEFVFETLTGHHYTPSTRSHHWNRVRCAAGLQQMDLYTCTRHYFAWYAWNVLRLSPEDIAHHFGHQDGGRLVRKTYGHFDGALSRARIASAFASAPAAPAVLPLREVS